MKIVIKDLSEENLDDHPCFKYGDEETVKMTKDWLTKVCSKFGPCVKVACVDDKPVGMVQYAPMDIFPHVDRPDAHNTIVVHCIFVPDEKYQRKGIARELMTSLIQDLKRPHSYLDGGHFEKIVAMAGKNRPGPAGPVEFFSKLGFLATKQISKEDILVEIQL